MIYSTFSLYAYLCMISVTLHVSVNSPTPKDPKAYDLIGCSGVFISPNEVLTAGHCLSHSRGHQWVKLNDGNSYLAVIEKVDVMKDLGLLKIPKLAAHEYVTFGSPVHVTDKICTVNSGDGYEKTYNEGFVNNLIDEEDTNTLTILHSATIFHGASGSGLFDNRGRLVGINVETIQSLVGAVDLTEINQFLKRRT